MDKEKWDTEKIEASLQKLPKMTDERSKEAILKRLKADERLRVAQPRKSKVFRWIPVAVAIAAVFFVTILWSSTEREKSQQDVVLESSADDLGMSEEESVFSSEATQSIGIERHIVLKETLGDDVYFQMNLLENGLMVPVTVILSQEQVEAAFANEHVTEAMLYERYADEIDISSLGFDATHEKVKEIETVVYYKYSGATGQAYFIPKVRANLTAEEALAEMATRPNEQVASVIPDSIQYTVAVQGDIAQIHFEDMLDLSVLEREEAMMLVEGFMLTAEQFNLAVQFDNISPSIWGAYDLMTPLPKPMGSNPFYDLYE